MVRLNNSDKFDLGFQKPTDIINLSFSAANSLSNWTKKGKERLHTVNVNQHMFSLSIIENLESDYNVANNVKSTVIIGCFAQCCHL